MLNNEFDVEKFREALLKGAHGKQHKQREKEARSQRKWAEEERDSKDDKKGSKPTFLRPSDIAGDYDFKRALRTTLGMPEGQTRIMTSADLQAFTENVKQMQTAYKGGITVDQVISLSLQDDIDRANKQIHTAMAQSRKNDTVKFITNASRESDVTHHYVHVQFQAFNELVFHPDRVRTTTVQNRLSKGKVKFECDCGRFQFWFRYLNTVADTVLGRKEGGFPKVRNPGLSGVACKHILRVMHWIKSPVGRQYLTMALEKERTRQVGAGHRSSKNELSRQLSEQVVKANTRSNLIKPNLMREVAKLEASARKKTQALLRAAQKVESNQQALSKLQKLRDAKIITAEEFTIFSKNLK